MVADEQDRACRAVAPQRRAPSTVAARALREP